MSQSHVARTIPTRGHRVRELVCLYRPLRDGEGRVVDVPTLALSTPRIAAATLAPLLAGEPVEDFGVACLSTRHRLLAWHVLARGSRSSAPVSIPDVFVPACLTPGTTALIVVHNHPSGDPDAERRRRAADGAPVRSGRCPRHRAARPPDRRRQRPLLQLQRERLDAPDLQRTSRGDDRAHREGHHVCRVYGSPQPVQGSSLRSDPAVRGWRP